MTEVTGEKKHLKAGVFYIWDCLHGCICLSWCFRETEIIVPVLRSSI